MNIIKRRIIWYILSSILVTYSIVAMVIWGINPGADFTGGTLIGVGFNTYVSANDVRESIKDLGLQSLSVSETGNNSVSIKTTTLERGEIDEIISTLKTNLSQAPSLGVTSVEEKQVQVIGPTLGSDMTKKAIIAVCIAVVAIILYIAWSFRKVQRPFSSWSMSTATIIALTHDIIVVIGFVCTINHFYGFEADGYLLVALLTILGFSVHDTIVVFDRIRENLLRTASNIPVEKTIEDSINQTLARSLNTSLTAILVLLALATIGGGAIRPFALTLLIGIAIGTYSSIFLASPILVTWTNIRNKFSKKNNKE